MVGGTFKIQIILPGSHVANVAPEYRYDNTNWREIAVTSKEVGQTNPLYHKPADATVIYQTQTPVLRKIFLKLNCLVESFTH
ncbi:MAG: hypothetical protein CMM76_10165 [Rhodospirillaceae bacterium]|nr:hypothetical protein [Rhodospirillaceae bacterium]